LTPSRRAASAAVRKSAMLPPRRVLDIEFNQY
jgi:hypothetical protein